MPHPTLHINMTQLHPIHTIYNLARLAKGTLIAISNKRINPKQIEMNWDDFEIISFDLFDTLIAWRVELGQKILLPALDSLHLEPTIREMTPSKRRLIWKHSRDAINRFLTTNGYDPVSPFNSVLAEFLHTIGIQDEDGHIKDQIIKLEIARITRMTTPLTSGLSLLNLALSRGKKVVITSDMHYSGAFLTEVSKLHGLLPVDEIYVSSDFGFSKFRGGLFRVLLEKEKVPPERVLHIGDNLWADVVSARAEGIQAVHMKVPHLGPDSAYSAGMRRVGSILARFAHILLLEAQARDKRHLAFASRDGYLLRLVVRRLMRCCPTLPQCRTSYVFFSRRAVSLPARRTFGPEVVQNLIRIRGGRPPLRRFLAQHDLEDAGLSLPSDEGLEGVRTLLRDKDSLARIAAIRERRTRLLADYLKGAGLWGESEVALVDIGWQGSTQCALNEAFGGETDWRPLDGFYLGRWNGCDTDALALGILGDGRRPHSLMESAPWQAALLLEALCRAPHATVTGYEAINGRIRPQLGAAQAPGEGDVETRRRQRQLWAGVLAAVDEYASTLEDGPWRVQSIRRQAQRDLLGLAFHPTPEELHCFGTMVHTEGDSEGWSLPLIIPIQSRFLVGEWRRGLSSAWKGGFMTVAGGWPLAAMYRIAESVLLRFPDLRFWIQRRVLGD